MDRYVEAEPTKSRGRIAESKMFLPGSPHFQKSPLTKAAAGSYQSDLTKCWGFWRPVRESNPCRRREREGTYGNSMELSGMDSTLPHLKDSRERLLDL
jgi:hypothetical protein